MSAPYDRFERGELILRDELAIDRTLLANERTFLAYARSAVALVLAGFSFIHFGDRSWFQLIGVLCLPLGVGTLIFGARRFLVIRTRILRARK